MLSGKKVLLGVSGGIAAYKTPLIVRLLIKQGAEVRVVMTPSALDFVTPLSNMVKILFILPLLPRHREDHFRWNNHELALWVIYSNRSSC